MQIKAIMKSHFLVSNWQKFKWLNHRALAGSLETGTCLYCYGEDGCNSFGKIIVDVYFMVPTKAAFVLRNEY